MEQTEILVIGVIYNTYPETLRYLESMVPPVAGKITVLLVDNSSRPAPADFREKTGRYPFVQYLDAGENTGYFGGARKGLEHYLSEKGHYPDWVLVTNVDICFTPGFFGRLESLEKGETPGVIAPAILSQRWHTDYNPGLTRRYPKRKLKFYRFIYSNFILQNIFLTGAYLKKWVSGRLLRCSNNPAGPGEGRKKIFAPHGACVIFRNSYFERGGTLDLPNFLFGEEIFIGETCARLGIDVIYDPQFVILDYEHASVGFFVLPRMNRYYRESIQATLELFYAEGEDRHGHKQC